MPGPPAPAATSGGPGIGPGSSPARPAGVRGDAAYRPPTFFESATNVMTTTNEKVAVITGASQGIGAALVQAYRTHGWAVVASSRSIPASDDAGIVTLAGDTADPAIARNVN